MWFRRARRVVKKLKDKKIMIYNDISGTRVPQFMPIHPGKLWAYTRQLSQDETHAARIASSQEERLFIINWRGDLHPSFVIRYRDKWYHITRIDPYEDYKNDIQIYVETKAGGNPKDTELIPFDPALRSMRRVSR
jgi:head-tail adaptor